MSTKRRGKEDTTRNEKVRKTEELTSKTKKNASKSGDAKEDLKIYADRVRKHVDHHGDLPPGQKFKTLNNIEPGSILEAHSYKTIATTIGSAYVLDVTLTREESNQTVREDFKLMIGSRFEEEIIDKLPCLLYYRGKQPMANGNLFHDLQAFKTNDESVFQTNADKPAAIATKTKKKTSVITDGGVLDESMKELYDQSIPCETCEITGDSCFGFCGGCGTHQPPDGSQCPC